VLPGDKVDAMLTRSKDGSPYVDALVQGLRVLAIDQLSSDQADKPVVSRSVTFEVDTEQAQKLALGAQVGQLSLALRNGAQGHEEAVRRITVDDLTPPEIQPPPETAVASGGAPQPVIRQVRKIRVYHGLMGDFPHLDTDPSLPWVSNRDRASRP
jgi:Flp pilus assembly protein CpaB